MIEELFRPRLELKVDKMYRSFFIDSNISILSFNTFDTNAYERENTLSIHMDG